MCCLSPQTGMTKKKQEGNYLNRPLAAYSYFVRYCLASMGLYEQYAVIMWSIAQITISRSSTMPASVKNARQFIKWSVIFNGCRHIFSIRKVKIVLQNKSDPPKCRHRLKWKSFIKLSVGVYRCRHIFSVRLVLQKKSDPPKWSETTVYRPCGSAKGKKHSLSFTYETCLELNDASPWHILMPICSAKW